MLKKIVTKLNIWLLKNLTPLKQNKLLPNSLRLTEIILF